MTPRKKKLPRIPICPKCLCLETHCKCNRIKLNSPEAFQAAMNLNLPARQIGKTAKREKDIKEKLKIQKATPEGLQEIDRKLRNNEFVMLAGSNPYHDDTPPFDDTPKKDIKKGITLNPPVKHKEIIMENGSKIRVLDDIEFLPLAITDDIPYIISDEELQAIRDKYADHQPAKINKDIKEEELNFDDLIQAYKDITKDCYRFEYDFPLSPKVVAMLRKMPEFQQFQQISVKEAVIESNRENKAALKRLADDDND